VGSGPAGTSWRIANVVLVLVALALVVTSVLLFKDGAAATPGDSRAEALSSEYTDVTKAARDETLAFLTVDYQNMDPLIAKVLAGSTGSFKEQYERAKVTLKASAQQSQARSTGKVLSVGIADIDDTDAVVFVAADSQVTNASTKGKAQPRYYRLKLTMLRKGDKWLTSNLQFVG
jgi:Mce-associated membrane protein